MNTPWVHTYPLVWFLNAQLKKSSKDRIWWKCITPNYLHVGSKNRIIFKKKWYFQKFGYNYSLYISSPPILCLCKIFHHWITSMFLLFKIKVLFSFYKQNC